MNTKYLCSRHKTLAFVIQLQKILAIYWYGAVVVLRYFLTTKRKVGIDTDKWFWIK